MLVTALGPLYIAFHGGSKMASTLRKHRFAMKLLLVFVTISFVMHPGNPTTTRFTTNVALSFRVLHQRYFSFAEISNLPSSKTHSDKGDQCVLTLLYGKPQGTRSRGCVFRASWVLTCPVNFSGHVVIFRGSWLRSGEKYR